MASDSGTEPEVVVPMNGQMRTDGLHTGVFLQYALRLVHARHHPLGLTVTGRV